MPHIRLQAVESQNDMALLLQANFDPLLIGDVQAHQFFIALQQMRHRSLRDSQAAGLEALMHLGDRAMLHKAPGANQRNDIQPKLAVRQRPASFFFRMVANMILRARGGMTLADRYAQLKDALQGDHLPLTVVGHPPVIATLWTGLLKRPQGGSELRFGFGGSPGHRLPPLAY